LAGAGLIATLFVVTVSVSVALAVSTAATSTAATSAAGRVGGEGDDVDPGHHSARRIDAGGWAERQSGRRQTGRVGLGNDRRNATTAVANDPAHRRVVDRVALLIHQAHHQGEGDFIAGPGRLRISRDPKEIRRRSGLRRERQIAAYTCP
jgi:hypothetical protein